MSPTWPAWGHDDRWAWRLDGVTALETVERAYLREGRLSQVCVIDSKLNHFRLAATEVVGRAGVFGWRPGYAGSYVRVRVRFEYQTTMSLSEAKAYILGFASRHPEPFHDPPDLQSVRLAVEASRSFDELLRAAT